MNKKPMDEIIEFETFVCKKYNESSINSNEKSIVCKLIDKFLEYKCRDVLCTKKELVCECDCHAFIGGSGKACPQCIKEKCGYCTVSEGGKN